MIIIIIIIIIIINNNNNDNNNNNNNNNNKRLQIQETNIDKDAGNSNYHVCPILYHH